MNVMHAHLSVCMVVKRILTQTQLDYRIWFNVTSILMFFIVLPSDIERKSDGNPVEI